MNRQDSIFSFWVITKPTQDDSTLNLVVYQSKIGFSSQQEAQLVRDLLGDETLVIRRMVAHRAAHALIMIDASAFIEKLIQNL